MRKGHFGKACYSIGFGTNYRTVAAASGWDEPMQIMDVRSVHTQSYERLFQRAWHSPRSRRRTRQPPEGCIHHYDRGSQYAAEARPPAPSN